MGGSENNKKWVLKELRYRLKTKELQLLIKIKLAGTDFICLFLTMHYVLIF